MQILLQALTDDEARRNWEKYGNPDGPGAMSFGIALPSWIVEKENSVWVLGLYALVFMVALPIVVSTKIENGITDITPASFTTCIQFIKVK